MENNELKQLITTFMEYRNLLTPIEQSLKQFSVSFESIGEDVKNLNSSFNGNVQAKLDQIYKELASQADKAKLLTSQVDSFVAKTEKYVQSVNNLVSLCGKLENKISTVEQIEKQAETQIEKLNVIIEDKRKTYNIKELEKNLEAYNTGVQKVSEFINKDVADVLQESNNKLDQIQNKNEDVLEVVKKQQGGIAELVETYKTSNEMLKKIVENNDVNQEYIYSILDKWAVDRKVKTKK